MRFLSLALVLGAAIWIGACGDQADTGGATPGDTSSADATTNPGSSGMPERLPIPLKGDGWDGGAGIDPTAQSDKVRVIQFFKPG